MTADEEPKVGSKRSRDESGDDDAEKKAAKEEETKVTDDAAGKEAEPWQADQQSVPPTLLKGRCRLPMRCGSPPIAGKAAGWSSHGAQLYLIALVGLAPMPRA